MDEIHRDNILLEKGTIIDISEVEEDYNKYFILRVAEKKWF